MGRRFVVCDLILVVDWVVDLILHRLVNWLEVVHWFLVVRLGLKARLVVLESWLIVVLQVAHLRVVHRLLVDICRFVVGVMQGIVSLRLDTEGFVDVWLPVVDRQVLDACVDWLGDHHFVHLLLFLLRDEGGSRVLLPLHLIGHQDLLLVAVDFHTLFNRNRQVDRLLNLRGPVLRLHGLDV